MAIQRWRPFSALESWGSLERGWDPFRWLSNVQREMNRIFEEAFGDTGLESLSTREWSPAVEVYETKDELVVRAELPGMKQSDIDVSVSDGNLIIRGERKRESEIKEENYYRSEWTYGAFRRSIPLPAGTDPNKIKATYQNGVLEVKLPKPEEAKPKQIKINVQ
ncbi:MAG TPA: Hsp20/alpha crystallin family protein [Candidatus Limnocylindrales bacterium]|nr:Hsp20/alpha crystallin family protein [Candidatus Limnocylindrales bacterium]